VAQWPGFFANRRRTIVNMQSAARNPAEATAALSKKPIQMIRYGIQRVRPLYSTVQYQFSQWLRTLEPDFTLVPSTPIRQR
jgi:hypothetical protein